MKHFLKYEKKSGREIIPNSQKVFILDLREIHPSGSNYQGCNMKIYIQIIQRYPAYNYMDYISEIEIEKVKEEFPMPGPLVTENPLANMAHIPIILAI